MKINKKLLYDAACTILTDSATLKIAKWIKMKSNGVAAKHLEHYLSGKGGFVKVDLEAFWKQDKKVAAYVSSKIVNDFFKKSVMKGTIPLPKEKYLSVKEWIYAVGSLNLNYEIKKVLENIIQVKLDFNDKYDWHPERESDFQCVHKAAEDLKERGAKDFRMLGIATVEIILPKAKPLRFSGQNFIGKPIMADSMFFTALKRIDKYAQKNRVKIHVTHSFRQTQQKLNGTVVKPASRSNHLVGHAIDFNLLFQKKLYTSKELKKTNLKNQPKAIQNFIQDINRDKELRWGGHFNDPIHIDIPMNHNNEKLWDSKYRLLQ